MNLFDMARRGDRNLVLSGEVKKIKRTYRDGDWRGLELTPGARFSIPDVRRFASLRHFPAQCGWMVDVPVGSSLRIAVVSGTDGTILSRHFVAGGEGLRPLDLPWPRAVCGSVDLVVSHKTGDDPIFVANHRMLSRQWLYDLCVGRGIEVGPGPVPQILPREGVEVSYLEQMPAEEWNRLYNRGGKFPTRPELWSNYIVGEASAPPVADGSLDFIFGSHVFEHLANPIGHLKRWRAKLAQRGKIVMVVPDLNGTKDSIHYRCSLESMVDEFQRDIWLPEKAHYMRHCRLDSGDKKLVDLMDRMESIHVHYYDNINCQILLDYAVRELGYADYVIEHTPNHKDFYFVLVNR
ncbi:MULTISPECIES: class I SAM-dependent methyltransferase [unclassified Sphingobium]|uniref:class I SAM-dependent methyltransferase n=1 Tax=unclassified Sphingobium TaxID=2611147 RepID=UPI002225451B|nr:MULTISPECIES: class I SAM-dependent methyltransferase [unclassified Sphingobium]MCW2411748.1 putative SAM-dependent methyltransferase [Sphingobium sp. B8D3D]MCW2415956.1 putative SAM-dependent methyltransferase [Sphingobium sp. B8D3A]